MKAKLKHYKNIKRERERERARARSWSEQPSSQMPFL